MVKKNSENKNTTKKQKRKKNRFLTFIKAMWIVIQVFIVLGLMGTLFAGAAAAGFFAAHVQDEPVREYDEIYELIHNYNQTGEAYFRNNEFIGNLRTSDVSQPVTLEEVSPHLIDAILATEDHVFYDHTGVNFKAVTRAAIEQFTEMGAGSGGSTITQQLVKNQVLTPERTFDRKFKEMLLAMRVERMFNKNEILEAYMNIVYMGYNANGSNVEGVQAAAEGIFGVSVKDLNIAQSAYLAGMIQSPGRYTPFTRSGAVNEEKLETGLKRMNVVLNRMIETQFITQAEYEEAKSFDIRESLAQPTKSIVENYPFLTFEIEQRANNILLKQILEDLEIDKDELTDEELDEYREMARRQLSRGGYKVYTTIDRELYEAFHEIAKNDELFGPRSREHTYTVVDEETGEEREIGYLEQTAVTLLDNSTGAIIAMIEGRDFNEMEYNLNDEPRQPGSSIKPLLDYAPAVELGLLQPATPVDDAPIFRLDGSGDYWVPRNWNNRYQGLVTTRKALEQSYNLPAIRSFLKVQEEAGEEVPFDYLKQMGITTIHENDYHAPSVAIGGMTYGMTVEENTNAFATFANNGVYHDSYLIERIETFDGEVVYHHDPQPKQVFSEQTAFLMNDMLRTVVNEGTASRVRRGMGSGLDIAGKTGTTNDKYDYWFIGYTPNVSMGVWTGYDKRETLQGNYSPRTQNLWVNLMKKVQELRPEYVNAEARFNEPNNIVTATVCSKSGMLPSKLCRQAGYLVTDYFNRQHVPTQVDDKVIQGRVITVNGKQYLAHDETPDDFVSTGLFVEREPLDIPAKYQSQRARYLPQDWSITAPEEEDPREDNGKRPDVPQGVDTVFRSSDGLNIVWQPVGDNDIAGYRIYRATQDGEFVHIGSVPDSSEKTYLDTGSSREASYAYRVTAVDISGNESDPSQIVTSNFSEPDSFFTPPGPSAPSGLSGSGNLLGVELTWNANAESDNVLHYTIYYSQDSESGYKQLTTTSDTSYTHSVLDGAGQYSYYVTATNEDGESEPSNIVQMNLGNQDSTDEEEPNQNGNGNNGNGPQEDDQSEEEGEEGSGSDQETETEEGTNDDSEGETEEKETSSRGNSDQAPGRQKNN
ncbi:transglycosylase domain-containing protein [Caldalkalibacillus salinus]|uniref:transglycosylase domain-containing protein n=1 Tax=Caldalkalibacillus salinus TaxID=2803787 RepID=UPI0019249694|nr:transglycosylase domain-containing protein [Caldalkalibacillus salinus]